MNRKVRGTELTTYNWERVPRQLLQKAMLKCRAQQPPISLKWKLIELLRNWVESPP